MLCMNIIGSVLVSLYHHAYGARSRYVGWVWIYIYFSPQAWCNSMFLFFGKYMYVLHLFWCSDWLETILYVCLFWSCVYTVYAQGGDTVKLKVQLSHLNRQNSRLTFQEHSLELQFQTRLYYSDIEMNINFWNWGEGWDIFLPPSKSKSHFSVIIRLSHLVLLGPYTHPPCLQTCTCTCDCHSAS